MHKITVSIQVSTGKMLNFEICLLQVPEAILTPTFLTLAPFLTRIYFVDSA